MWQSAGLPFPDPVPLRPLGTLFLLPSFYAQALQVSAGKMEPSNEMTILIGQ